MNKHTQGPWTITAKNYIDGKNEAVGRVSPANAARIVECVNALQGVKDPRVMMGHLALFLKGKIDTETLRGYLAALGVK